MGRDESRTEREWKRGQKMGLVRERRMEKSSGKETGGLVTERSVEGECAWSGEIVER